jgi:hypothetical protein
MRLPTLVVWLSFGLRGPGAAVERGEAQEGFVLLEVAVPSRCPGKPQQDRAGGLG